MAGITTTTTATLEYQTFYTDYLLDHVVQLLVLDQFADKKPFPKGAGAKSIRFFKKGAADDAQVQTLVEGTAPASGTYRQITLANVDVTLTQYGQVASVTDILTWTDKLRVLKETIGTMTEDCALKADVVIRNDIIATNIADFASPPAGQGAIPTARIKKYAGTATTFATLQALNQTTGALTGLNVLDQKTSLVLNRAQRIQGDYIMIAAPNITRDLMNDSKWINVSSYSKPSMLFNGEAGIFYGCRVVEQTNPFIEDGLAGAEGTLNTAALAANAIFPTFFTGKGAYGCPIMAGQSPFSPKVFMVDEADHSDPLLQQTLAGYKTYWGSKLYHSDWLIVFRSKSGYGV